MQPFIHLGSVTKKIRPENDSLHCNTKKTLHIYKWWTADNTFKYKVQTSQSSFFLNFLSLHSTFSHFFFYIRPSSQSSPKRTNSHSVRFELCKTMSAILIFVTHKRKNHDYQEGIHLQIRQARLSQPFSEFISKFVSLCFSPKTSRLH